MKSEKQKVSLRVLEEAAALQRRKSLDYQNPLSRIKQADHYPRGCATILDMAYQKLIRMYSLLEAYEKNEESPQFESLSDSAIDAINYLSFFVEYLEHAMDGQRSDRDILNREKNTSINKGKNDHE